MTLADLLTILVYLLMLSIFPAGTAWLVNFVLAQRRKLALMNDEAWGAFASGAQVPAEQREPLDNDPKLRRMKRWDIILFCWPLVVVIIAAAYFNFVLPQIS